MWRVMRLLVMQYGCGTLIGVNRISIYSVFLRYLYNRNARSAPLCANITLTPNMCEF